MNMDKHYKALAAFMSSGTAVRWSILVLLTVVFTIIVYPNLAVKQHAYQLGDVVEHDIKAPKDFLVRDDRATEESRKRAIRNVLTVYDHDTTLLPKVTERVIAAFDLLQRVIETTDDGAASELSDPRRPDAAPPLSKPSVRDLIWQKKNEFETKLGLTVSKEAYRILEKESFSQEISNLIIQISTAILENGIVANKEILLKESEKGITLRDLGTKTERIFFDLKKFYSLDQSKAMVRIIGQPLLKGLHYSQLNLVVDFSQRLLQPNITLNRSETEERKNRAADAIRPIFYQIKAGEMILREGDRANEIQLLKLKNLQSQTRDDQALASGLGVALVVLCLFLITYLPLLHRHPKIIRKHNKNLLFMASVLVIFLFIVKISTTLSGPLAAGAAFTLSETAMTAAIPVAAGAMTICLFMGFDVAVAFGFVLSALTALLLQNRFDIFFYFFMSSLMGAYWIQDCRERKSLIKAAVKLGVLNMILMTAINVHLGETAGMKMLWDWAFAFLGGIIAGVVTLGITPLFEITFGYTTDITLLELANLDRPILKQLMLEAPGTYHHSVLVGTIVEAAASEIGANPLLAKVCGYYHDIGKLKNPLYFIENQSNGKNRHDKLAPSMSSLILIAHIKNGVEIARENKLGDVIIDAIRQHHGTSLISYFYEKAKQLKGEDAVKIEDFRYPGPKPQTREAGLVMLADVVEAASRTLENPTPSRIQGLVQNLINKIFSDGQLDECELTLKDLHKIARSYNKILNGIHHHRIEYSDSTAAGNGKVKNGDSDRQPAKSTPDISGERKESSARHLKRLGIS